MDIGLGLALWLHTLALVIAIGYYGVLGRFVIPTLEQSVDGAARAKTLVALERRALPSVLLSVVLFIVTGTYLLFVSSHYAGLGNLFATTWTTLIVIKHVLVVGFVALGVAFDVFVRDVGEVATDRDRATALGRARLTAEAATGLGAMIILLTALAQVS